MTRQLYILLAILGAVILDLALIYWLRRRRQAAHPAQEPLNDEVYVLGIYSPLLTWLRKRITAQANRPDEKHVVAKEHQRPPENHVISGPGEENITDNGIRSIWRRWRQAESLSWEIVWRSNWFEHVFLLLVVWLFGFRILDLAAPTRLAGNESEVFQILDWTLINSLRHYGAFPLWNPYLHTGLPYIADPMLHLYNPVVTLPVLLLGVGPGFKLAVWLSILLAAYGMRRLAEILGMGRPARLWTAVLFAIAGQPAARFFQGQYLFVFGFTWLPWILGYLFLLHATRRRRYVILTALFLALLFFSGNAYYTFYMLIVCGLFALALGINRGSTTRLELDWNFISRLALVGVLAIGLVAVQLFPQIEFWPRIRKAMDLAGSHTLSQIFLDYTSKDSLRPDAYQDLPAREEFYAYIGLAPFLGLLLIPLAWRNYLWRRKLVFFGLVLAFTVTWIGLEWVPWYSYFVSVPFLLQFRHLLRILIFGSLALIVIAGFGVDALWQQLAAWADQQVAGWQAQGLRYWARITLVGLAVGLVASGWDVFSTNRPHLQTKPANRAHFSALGWLRSEKPGEYYVRFNPSNSAHEAVVSSNLRYLDAWYHFDNIRDLSASLNGRTVSAQPNYIVQVDKEVKEPGRADFVAEVAGVNIYALLDSLPFAFAVPYENLQPEGYYGDLDAGHVRALEPQVLSPNRIRVIASNQQPAEVLVMLITHYPGWRLAIDGHPAALQKVGGYLAAFMPDGEHTYTFSYRPMSFYWGLLVSTLCLGASLFLLLGSPARIGEQFKNGWRTVGGWLRRRRGRQARPGASLPERETHRPWLLPQTTTRQVDPGAAPDGQGVAKITLELPAGAEAYLVVRPACDSSRPEVMLAPVTYRIRSDGSLERISNAVSAGAQTYPYQPPEAQATLAAPAVPAAWPQVAPTPEAQGEGGQAPAPQPASAHTQARLRWKSLNLPLVLFGVGLAVYLLVRLIGLTDFPIYFFTDEAVQTMLAHDLIRDGLRNGDKVFLPTYFKNGTYYNLSVSVYAQVLPYLVFGKSVFVTRATSVLLTLLAAVSVGLILRDFFKAPYWWTAPLVLSVMPAWFLHSRTAFETALFVSFYAGMLYFYLRYRFKSPENIYPTLILAALAFYSYSPGQVIVAVTGVLLLLSDAEYHWLQRRYVLRGAGLALLLALPYMRFWFTSPETGVDHLRQLSSYWMQPLPLSEKVRRYFQEYFYGLSVGYWFVPNERDLERHLMRGYGHLLRPLLPFMLLGGLISLRKIRHSEHRLLLIAALAAPAGAALVGIGITRVLVFVIPASLWVALGMNLVLGWLENPGQSWAKLTRTAPADPAGGPRIPYVFLALPTLLILSAANLGMLSDALRNGPTWYTNYGMGGLQYGARRLFQEIEATLAEQPELEIICSPNWANGTDVLARFFLGDPLPIRLGSVEGHFYQHLPLDEDTVFVTTPDEYQQVYASQKFTDIRVLKTVAHPTGEPGFYFLRMRYVDDIDAILAAEQAERRALQQDEVEFMGHIAQVNYPSLDMGEIRLMFDGDPYTFGRTWEANPARISLELSQPVSLHGLEVIIGSIEARITAEVFTGESNEPQVFRTTRKGSVEQPAVSLDFGGQILVRKLNLVIEDIHQSEPAHIHIWEIRDLAE